MPSGLSHTEGSPRTYQLRRGPRYMAMASRYVILVCMLVGLVYVPVDLASRYPRDELGWAVTDISAAVGILAICVVWQILVLRRVSRLGWYSLSFSADPEGLVVKTPTGAPARFRWHDVSSVCASRGILTFRGCRTVKLEYGPHLPFSRDDILEVLRVGGLLAAYTESIGLYAHYMRWRVPVFIVVWVGILFLPVYLKHHMQMQLDSIVRISVVVTAAWLGVFYIVRRVANRRSVVFVGERSGDESSHAPRSAK